MKSTSKQTLELGLSSPADAMEAFVQRHAGWIETAVGCPRGEALTLEVEIPFSHIVLPSLLEGAVLDHQCLGAATALARLVKRWETPPGASPRIELIPSRDRRARVTERPRAWDPHWKETPIALWLEGAQHAIVSLDIPYVSFIDKGALSWRQWVIVNRIDAAYCLNLMRQLEAPRQITVIGGRDIPLPEEGYDWETVLLDPEYNQQLRPDYETFWESEPWFTERKIPYRRGFLLYGPPGNGKTTAVRIMASHPLVSAFTLDFSCDGLPNEALTDLFQAAADRAPSLIILEDLDRVFGAGESDNRTRITTQHLLTCMDGLARQNGIVVTATANDPALLDQAILKRPGRFDRLVPFPNPTQDLRRKFLHQLSSGKLGWDEIEGATAESDRMSFAQLREAYILAGQRSFRRGGAITGDDLITAVRTTRAESMDVAARSGGRTLGFEGGLAASGRPTGICRQR